MLLVSRGWTTTLAKELNGTYWCNSNFEEEHGDGVNDDGEKTWKTKSPQRSICQYFAVTYNQIQAIFRRLRMCAQHF